MAKLHTRYHALLAVLVIFHRPLAFSVSRLCFSSLYKYSRHANN